MNIKKHIPNTITCLNLLSGVIGIVVLFGGRPDQAFFLMLAAAVFDFCDGLAARALGAYSEIGRELDSLADVVSFGVLPSLMLFVRNGHPYLCFVALLPAAFSALRLAKFNLDERQHASFLGLPTPAAAMICGAWVCYAYVSPDSRAAWLCNQVWFIPVLALAISALLVCEVPMFSMKLSTGKKASVRTSVLRIAFFVLVAVSAIYALVAGKHLSLVFLVAFSGYVLLNLINSLLPE